MNEGCIRTYRSGVQFLNVQGIVDEEAYRLSEEAEEKPKGHISQLAVVQLQILRQRLLEEYGGSLHDHGQKSVVAYYSQRNADQVLMGHCGKNEN